jgi:PAS domain S-box-containing protein
MAMDKQVLFPADAVEAQPMFVILDKEHNIVQIDEAAKKAAEHMMGISPGEGQSIYDFIFPRFIAILKRDLEQCFRGEHLKKRVLHSPDGYVFSYQLRLIELKGESFTLLEAIAELGMQEQLPLLERPHAFLDNLFNTISIGIKISDVRGTILLVNKAYQKMIGFNQARLINNNVIDCLAEHEREQAAVQLKAFIEKDVMPKRHWQMLHADGSILHVDLSISKALVKGEYKVIYSITDMTKQYELEQEINRSKVQMEALVDNLSTMLWSVDENLKCLTVNKTAQEYIKLFYNTTFKPGDALAPVFGDFTEAREERMAKYREVLNTGKHIPIDTLGVRDGQFYHFSGEMYPLHEGEIIRGVICTLEEDTPDFLRKTFSRGLNRFLVNCAKAKTVQEVFWHLANDILNKLFIEEGEIMVLNQKELRSVVIYRDGVVLNEADAPDEVLTLQLNQGLIGACASEGLTFIVSDSEQDKRVISVGKSFKSEIAVPIMVRDAVYGVINCESAHKNFFKPIFKEILESAAKEAGDQIRKLLDEEKISEVQLHYSSILNSTPNSFLLVDKNLRVLSFNKTASTFLPKFWGKDLKIGVNYLSFVSEEDQALFSKAVERSLHGELISVEHKLLHPRYGERWLNITFAPAVNQEQAIFGITLILEDVTKAKEAETITLNQNYELKKANRELDQFVYSISHDVRAPLSSIQGLSGLIGMSTSLEEVREYNAFIKESAVKLDTFIRNILNYSRNKRKSNHPEWVELESMVQQIMQAHRFEEGFESIDFQLDLKHKRIFTDPFRFRLILDALLSNAIRYHHPKRAKKWIRLTVEEGESQLRISVEDNGQGIKADLVDGIFDMFVTANPKAKGNGIGMYILKETVDFMQGDIKVKSTFGKGTSVNITLPK